jgi:hypothetical protein
MPGWEQGPVLEHSIGYYDFNGYDLEIHLA